MESQLLHTGSKLKAGCFVLSIIQIEKEKRRSSSYISLSWEFVIVWRKNKKIKNRRQIAYTEAMQSSKEKHTKMKQMFLLLPVKGKQKAMCYRRTEACECFAAEQKDTFLASRISYNWDWVATHELSNRLVFSLCANFSVIATPFIFPILSDPTVGVALHFWGVPSPVSPLLFLCCATLELLYQLLQAHHTSRNPQVSTARLESLTI